GVTPCTCGKDTMGPNDPIPGYSKVTPAMIISALARIVDELGLPHPLHLHCNHLGAPGNYATTLETMKLLEGKRAHLAHLQYHAYGGDGRSTPPPRAGAPPHYLHPPPHPTTHTGPVPFSHHA